MELGIAQVLLPELAPAEERGGGVARCPTESGGGGDALAEVNAGAARMVRLIPQSSKRAQGEIVRAGQRIVVAAQLQISGRGQGEAIGEIDGHEDGGDLMESVVAAADHLQTEIQLGRGVDDDLSLARSSAVTKKVSFCVPKGKKAARVFGARAGSRGVRYPKDLARIFRATKSLGGAFL